jgi:SMC interacting uncharacterized protein involved in chromosome segregation
MVDNGDNRFNDLKETVSKVQEELSSFQKDVAALKTDVCVISKQVSNHIPHQIEELKIVLQKLDSRIIPFESNFLKYRGVSEFLTHVTKVSITLAGLTWSILRIYSCFIKH